MISISSAFSNEKVGDGGHNKRCQFMSSQQGSIKRRSSNPHRNVLRSRLPMRSSPYVGWFRHAPPSSSSSTHKQSNACSTLLLKQKSASWPRRCRWNDDIVYRDSSHRMRSSPYIGWFRHSPPSSAREVRKRLLLLTTTTMDDAPSSAERISTLGSEKKIITRNTKVNPVDETPTTKSVYHDAEFCRSSNNNNKKKILFVDGNLNGGSPLYEEDNNDPTTQTNQALFFPPLTTLLDIPTQPDETNNDNNNDDDISVASSTSSTSFLAAGQQRRRGEEPSGESATLTVLTNLANLLLSPVTKGTLRVDLSSKFRRCLLIEDGGATALFSENSHCFTDETNHDTTQITQEYNNSHTHTQNDRSLEENEHSNSSTNATTATTTSPSPHQPSLTPLSRPVSAQRKMEGSISSLAEAYYAHEAAKELMMTNEINPLSRHDSTTPPGQGLLTDDSIVASSSSHSNPNSTERSMTNPLLIMPPSPLSMFHHSTSDFHDDDNNINRLDYVITQMDIARMVRNASRHLDVESILSLPTETYQSSSSQGNHPEYQDIPIETTDSSILRDGTVVSSHDTINKEEKTDVAAAGVAAPADGWSWMMVPSDPEDESTKDKSKKPTLDLMEPNTSSLYSSKLDITTDEEDEIITNTSNKNNNTTNDENDVCVICLEKFNNGDRLRVLPCAHRFHMGCIDKWLLGTYSDQECFTSGCPTCKKRPDVLLSSKSKQSEEVIASSLVSSTGEVPSWAFAKLGDAMARDSFTEG